VAPWIIAVPAWGDRALALFADHGLPSIKAALKFAGIRDVQFHVHTDRPRLVRSILTGFDVHTSPADEKVRPHLAMTAAHHEVIDGAKPGSKIALICADMVVSKETFAAMNRRFAGSSRLIAVASIRTEEQSPPLRPMATRDLLAHAAKHRHKMMREVTWGSGCSVWPSVLLFENEGSLVVRGFHLHPLAFVKDREIAFRGTVDWDLFDNFSEAEITVITDQDELAALELSPPEHAHHLGRPISVDRVREWMMGKATPRHRFLFQHRVIFTGDGIGCADEAVADALFAEA
jgi:hypothetical protein